MGVWCAVFINLKRRTDRRMKLARTLASGNAPLLARLARIEAVDGRSLSLDDPCLHRFISRDALLRAQEARRSGAFTVVHHRGRLVRFHDHLTEGAAACAMSHHAALRAIARHPTADWGLILEDDITALVPRVHQVLGKVVMRLPTNWDAVFLGYHGGTLASTAACDEEAADEDARASLELEIDEMRGRSDGFKGSLNGDALGSEGPPLLRMFSPVYGLYAWMVRKEVARELTERAFPVDSQVDHALSQWLVEERGRAFRVAPKHLLFFSPKSERGLDSDVQTMAKLDELLEDPLLLRRYCAFLASEGKGVSAEPLRW